MKLRKERIHHTGSSNLLKPEMSRPMSQPGQSRWSIPNLPKANQIDEIIERKASRAVATPLEKTRLFYDEKGKTEHQKAHISNPRTSNLEEKEKMKIAFTGDSFFIYDKNLKKYREQDSLFQSKKEGIDKDHLAKEKHEVHAIAIQETQLVGFDNLETIKNNVNLEKVREARRILRRKYANRKNMHMIFSAWDYEKTGNISIHNLYSMSKILGLNLNFDEARVLLASADRNGSGTLSLDEFFDLIHNKDDALNIDLKKLAKYSENYLLHKEDLERADENIIKKLEEDARKGREIKHINQVNLILKNKLNEIALNLLNMDPFKKGYTTFDCFEHSIKKLGIDEKLVGHSDIKILFNKYKRDEHTINYKEFIDGLKSFNFLFEEAYKEYETPRTNENTDKNKAQVQIKKDEIDIHIADCRNVPYDTIYNYLGKKRKVARFIQKFFPIKEDFRSYLSKSLNFFKESNSELISKKQAKELILNLFEKFDVTSLSQRDFEGFLSSFIYNRHGFTQVNDVLNGIYEDDDDGFINKINARQNGPPPHKDIAISSDETKLNGLDSEQKQKKIKEILNKVDGKLFIERKPAYELYKMFDADRDGYISRKDFIKKAEEIFLFPKDDIQILVEYLDSENKGYVNFREFHQKIRTNPNQQDSTGKQTVFPSVMPSKEHFENVAKLLPGTKKKVEELEYELKPENNGLLRPSSRFGSAPAWKNTFQNHQPSIWSPMFIPERERFNLSPNAKVQPVTEEKEKKRRIQSAKVDIIRHNQDILKKRVEEDTNKQDMLDQNRLKIKASSIAIHEQNARLRNNFF